MVTCRGCGETKTPDEMSKSGSGKRCKACRNSTNRSWLDDPVVRARANAHTRASHAKLRTNKRRHLREMYNLTLEEYDEISARQNHECLICLEPCKSGKALSVDHCHKCGQVRGLLCGRCNAGIGFFRDSQELMYRATRYLQGVDDDGHPPH